VQMDSPSRARGYFLVLGAATAWGALGLFYTVITRLYALPPETIVFFRASLSLLMLAGALALFKREWLRIQRRDVPHFVGMGVLGLAGTYVMYAYAVNTAGMSVSAILMYTAPVWVTLYAWRFLGEGLGWYKGLALLLAFAGAALVAQVYNPANLLLNLAGVAWGLGAGVAYGSYIIFNKYVVRRYSAWTAFTYALVFGWPALALTQDWSEVGRALATPSAMFWLLGLAIGPSLGGGLLYAAGLKHLPASVASIVVSWEPVMASLLAFAVFGERLFPGQVVGAAMIVGSIVMLGARDAANRPRPVPAVCTQKEVDCEILQDDNGG